MSPVALIVKSHLRPQLLERSRAGRDFPLSADGLSASGFKRQSRFGHERLIPGPNAIRKIPVRHATHSSHGIVLKGSLWLQSFSTERHWRARWNLNFLRVFRQSSKEPTE